MGKRILLIIVILMAGRLVSAQVIISGKVTDSASSKPVSFCQISVIDYKDSLRVKNILTDNEGNYSIKVLANSNYLLIIKNSFYRSVSREILFITSTKDSVVADFILIPQVKQLQEVVIVSKMPPIIIKGDTIIYDIKHFANSADENLEDVLKNISDFEIGSDGEIKVKGKAVNKVLINGEEFLNVGAALTTKSITPDMIKNVEVRFKEKDEKLKESLISNQNLIVLDIKLKDSLNKSIFGNSKLAAGAQDQLLFAGYSNNFSLNKKVKFHLLGEYDQFGHQSISLGQLKDLNKEAYLSIFELPSNFNGIKQNPEYNKEIYGVRDYSVYQPSVMAFTVKIVPSEKIDITIGTYNTKDKVITENLFTQNIFGTLLIRYVRNKKLQTGFTSKNRIELVYRIKDKFRAEYNLIYTELRNHQTQDNSETSRAKIYSFKGDFNSTTFLQNAKLEFKVNNKLGIQVLSLWNSDFINQKKKLQHNDTDYISLLKDDNGELVTNFGQFQNTTNRSLVTSLNVRYQFGSFVLNGGYRILNELLHDSKQAVLITSRNTSDIIFSPFTTPYNTLKYIYRLPFIEWNFSKGIFSFQNQLGVGNVTYPILGGGVRNKKLFDSKIQLTVRMRAYDDISLTWQQRVSAFPLQKLTGFELIDFQTIGIGNRFPITPQTEQRSQLSLSSSLLEKVGIAVTVASAFVTSNTADGFTFTTPFLGVVYQQLKADYLLATIVMTKTFNKIPLAIKAEPFYMSYAQENLTSTGESYFTSTAMKLMRVSILSLFEKKVFDFKVSSDFNVFQYRNKIASLIGDQKYVTTEFIANYTFMHQKALQRFKFRNTKFIGEQSANYFNIFLKGQYKLHRLSFYYEVDNLLNNAFFYKRELTPTYQVDTRNNTYSRYLKIGFEYRFR